MWKVVEVRFLYCAQLGTIFLLKVVLKTYIYIMKKILSKKEAMTWLLANTHLSAFMLKKGMPDENLSRLEAKGQWFDGYEMPLSPKLNEDEAESMENEVLAALLTRYFTEFLVKIQNRNQSMPALRFWNSSSRKPQARWSKECQIVISTKHRENIIAIFNKIGFDIRIVVNGEKLFVWVIEPMPDNK
jgi:hypothetical protein